MTVIPQRLPVQQTTPGPQMRTADAALLTRTKAQAVDYALNAMAIAAPDGCLVYVNPAFLRLWGYTEEDQVLGRDATSFWMDPETAARVIEVLHRQGEWTGELEARNARGEPFWVELRGVLIRDVAGKPLHMVGSCIDITARRRAEEALRRSLETYARAEAIAHIGSWDWDIVTGELSWSDEIYRIFGLTPQSFGATYQAFLDTIHPQDRQRVIDAVNASVADADIPYSIEHRVVRPDGQIRHVHEQGQVYRDGSGRPVRMIGTVHDITERKKVELELERYRQHLEELVAQRTAALVESEALLRQAQAMAHLGHWTSNLQTGELVWSDEIYRIFGQTPQSFTPSEAAFFAAVHPDDVDKVRQAVQQAFENDTEYRIDHRIVRPDGEVRWVHEEAMTEKDGEGRPWRLTGTVQDITERKLTEQALERAKEAAEAASRAKSEFLARMSHELRTPMNAILGFAQVLQLQPMSGEQQEFVREILQAGEHLLELINELLDLSRIEAGKLAVAIETVELKPILDQAFKLVEPQIVDMALTYTCTVKQGCWVLADATRLRQVLVNLLSNAVKYNRPGGRIMVTCESVAGDSWRVRVADTGYGIAPDMHNLLFKPFERLGAEKGAVEGTGIGLAVSLQLVRLMGGELGVESEPGRGACFWLELPSAPPPSTAIAAAETLPETAPDKARLLYVEDNAANYRVIAAVLRQHPHITLIGASSGEHALELVRRHRPDAILMDIHLPDIDGYAVLAALQADPQTRDIPVIALSADALPIDVERGLQAGFRAYLTKPVRVGQLMAALRGVLGEAL
ncbi:MAG: PAS domain-containing protein [Thiobacillaceae bacterium]